jgi:hypothetical protein
VGSAPACGVLRRPAAGEPLLSIYRYAYRARLVAALRDNFSVLPMVMGDEAFDALADAYVAATPSTHASIRWYGDSLVTFMAAREDLVPHPAIVDLARMDWALRAAFDAADATPIGAASLNRLAADQWPRLVLRFVPSVEVLDLQWAVEPVWRAMQAGDATADQELPEPTHAPHGLLVWRQGLENRWRSLDAIGATLLQAAIRGQDFSSLCEAAARSVGDEQAAAQVVAQLQAWLADGLIAEAVA